MSCPEVCFTFILYINNIIFTVYDDAHAILCYNACYSPKAIQYSAYYFILLTPLGGITVRLAPAISTGKHGAGVGIQDEACEAHMPSNNLGQQEGKRNHGKRRWEGIVIWCWRELGGTSLTGTLPLPPPQTSLNQLPHEQWAPHGCRWGICLPPPTHLPHGRCPSSSDLFVLPSTNAPSCTAVKNILPLWNALNSLHCPVYEVL